MYLDKLAALGVCVALRCSCVSIYRVYTIKAMMLPRDGCDLSEIVGLRKNSL